tara:strand:- start:31 stop:294 length:264 start_codon:yes stop_codon:yes gene_type:complete
LLILFFLTSLINIIELTGIVNKYKKHNIKRVLNVKKIRETKVIPKLNKIKIVNFDDIEIFFNEKVGILLIKENATTIVRYGEKFLIS